MRIHEEKSLLLRNAGSDEDTTYCLGRGHRHLGRYVDVYSGNCHTTEGC